jgi:hypothetical protein
MKYRDFLLTVIVLAALSTSAWAGIFFHRHAKGNPAEDVPLLIQTMKTSSDEHKRASAAQQLREFDPATFPEITPILIDVLQHDSAAAVRSEAVQSLVRLRPVSDSVGLALEEAAEHDASFRVRFQAKTSLMQYRLSGYRAAPKKEAPPIIQQGPSSAEPPLADPPPSAGPHAARRQFSNPNATVASPMPAMRTIQAPVPSQQTDGPELVPPQ